MGELDEIDATVRGRDNKNADLLAFYGLSGHNFRFLNTNISLGDATINATSGEFTGGITNADLDNRARPISVPIPSTLGLLGAGLIGLSVFARRRAG